MPTPLLATKLKNQIHAIDSTIAVSLRNVSVNGRKMGCSGFIYHEPTRRTVYISTDNNHGTNTRALFRGARDSKDYTGGLNQFIECEALAATVVAFIKAGDDRLWPKK